MSRHVPWKDALRMAVEVWAGPVSVMRVTRIALSLAIGVLVGGCRTHSPHTDPWGLEALKVYPSVLVIPKEGMALICGRGFRWNPKESSYEIAAHPSTLIIPESDILEIKVLDEEQ